MAANNTEHNPFLRWSSALIFLLVAWGIVVSPTPLESRRPPAEPGALWPTGQKMWTHARLWQDPLTSAANAAAEAATEWKKEAGVRPGA
jgi:hypothetical protein